jgi:hypothetical protein
MHASNSEGAGRRPAGRDTAINSLQRESGLHKREVATITAQIQAARASRPYQITHFRDL